MKPRITIAIDERSELQIYLNEAGRDLLMRELQVLSERSDHFHFGPEDLDGEVPVQSRAYREGERVLEWGKVMLRPDAWDARHFPHVLDNSDEPST